MSPHWRNFSPDELSEIGAMLPPFGDAALAQRCPCCGEQSLRWYHYLNSHRAHSKISYVWCGQCRRFFGATTLQEKWDLPDPFAASTARQRTEMEADLDSYFEGLDQLWDAGALRQVRETRLDSRPTQ